jgi:hypothetical protein
VDEGIGRYLRLMDLRRSRSCQFESKSLGSASRRRLAHSIMLMEECRGCWLRVAIRPELFPSLRSGLRRLEHVAAGKLPLFVAVCGGIDIPIGSGVPPIAVDDDADAGRPAGDADVEVRREATRSGDDPRPGTSPEQGESKYCGPGCPGPRGSALSVGG